MGIDTFNSVTSYSPTTPNSAMFTRPHQCNAAPTVLIRLYVQVHPRECN